ncbi:MAG: hypothetical protein ACI88A_003406 [Paraglaciecola sp.]|jgi:hypothetical protein
MLNLEERYGDVYQRPIGKWVKQCQSSQWQDVSFAYLLNMRSGNYSSAAYFADEGSLEKLAYFNAKSNRDRFTFAYNHYARKSQPGKTFVYQTSDTYLMSAGLNAYVNIRLVKDANLLKDVLQKHIFQLLGLSQITAVTLRTDDSDQQAYTGYGLFLNCDDLIRLSLFFE